MITQEEIQDLFTRFRDLRILVIGDVMIDRYLHGRVDRISPEAPVPVVQLDTEDNRPGGAANVALNLRAIGLQVDLASVVGTDSNGDLFRNLLEQEGIGTDLLLQDPERPTTVKTRVLAQNQHLLRVDRELVTNLSPAIESHLINNIRQRITTHRPDLILFQDYDKGVLTPSVIRDALLFAEQAKIPTAVDPKKKNFWAYHRVTLFKPNLKEVRDSVQFVVEADPVSLQKAAGHIRERLDNQLTLITLSDRGLFIDAQGDSLIVPTRPRLIADVCGAGDTVISVAGAALAAGASPAVIAELSNLAGGQVCERVGVVPVDRQALLAEYRALAEA